MRTTRLMVVALVWSLALVAPALAQEDRLRITTPYPAVAVEAGQTATFQLTVTAPAGERVALEVSEAPEGWENTLRGGGFVIDGIIADPEDPPDVRLEVQVPVGASEGVYRVVVSASGASGSDELLLELRIAEVVPASVTLTSQFPSLRGPADASYTFNLTLVNETPEEATFSLQAEGPPGWQVDARPTGQRQAATATVAGGGSASLTVEVIPSTDTPAGVYPITVRAVGGGRTAEVGLEVEITGNFAMRLRTPDDRLNATVRLGTSTELLLVVINDGTAPLVDLTLSATPPRGWEVTFDPERLELVPPREVAQVTATITPAAEAVAGDYVVTMRASVPEARDQIEVRTTVEASPLWGFVGLLLIVAVLIGLGWVFRRYGRR